MEKYKAVLKPLAVCFDVQKTYGQDSKRIFDIAKTFAWMLDEYPTEEIERAFKIWLRTEKDFPTPADIINLIEGEKPKLSASYYNSLIQRQAQGNQLSFAEQDFKEKFEAQQHELADYKPPVKRETKALADYPKHIAENLAQTRIAQIGG